MRKIGKFVLVMLLTILFVLMIYAYETYTEDSTKNNSSEESDVISSFGIDQDSLKEVKVSRVIDGDTFVISDENNSGNTYKCRLIGIDTPESVATGDNEYKNCEEGKIASDYLKKLIEGKTIKIDFDLDKFDDYERLLVYAYTEDGQMINELLLRNGYARTMTILPNTKYKAEFAELEEDAKGKKSGFWELEKSPWVN